MKEKQLYDLLVLLYRSPESLLKVTGTDINYADDESDSKPTNRSDFDLGAGSGSSATNFDPKKGKQNEGGSDDRSEHSKQD